MKITQKHINKVVKKGNWIVRTDIDGKSYNNFQWGRVGEWTEAPDWNESPICEGGLFGQDKDYYGFCKKGTRFVFCETDGHHVSINNEKVKVRRARILLVNQFPKGFKFSGSLYLSGCKLPDGKPCTKKTFTDTYLKV